MHDDVLRIGIGGAVGAGKTALTAALVPRLIAVGRHPAVVTNDTYTQEGAHHLRRRLAGVLDPGRVVGVETGASPHTAVRDDPTVNLLAGAALLERFPDVDTLLYESVGGDLTFRFSPVLADVAVFVLDTSEGDATPRKRGPAVTASDVLVINKIDIAAYVRTDLDVMWADARRVRAGRPVRLTNSLTGEGVDDLQDTILALWGERAGALVP